MINDDYNMQNDTTLPKTLPAFFWHFVKPYKLFLCGFLFIASYWAVANSILPYVLKLIIDRTFEFDTDRALIFDAVKYLVILYITLWTGMACVMRLLDWVKLRLFPSIREDIINAMFKYLNKHSYSYFQNNFAGSLSNKISDMTGGTIAIFTTLDDAFAQTLGMLVAITTMFIVHPIFAGIFLVWAVFFVGVALYFSRHIKVLSDVFATSKTTLVGKIVDSVSNAINVRTFSRNDYEQNQIKIATTDTVTKDRAMQWQILRMHILFDVSVIALMSAMMFSLVYMYSKGLVTVGDFAFVISLSISMFFHLWYIASQFVQFAEHLGKCSQALTMITAPHEITDADDAKQLNVTKGNIEFDNVTFHYNKGTNVFENKDVVIESGQKVGLIGFSGSGKTTFVNLMLRFFDVESGKITIDGQNIAEVTQDSLRENISMIPQDTSLFHRSLMDNIRYGRIDATDEEVIEASKQAHCHEFIEQLPEGYESLVGERGIKLSGGQRQRIAIARAMLKNAPILILDEATSALDSVTEKQIQEGLHSLMEGCTTIVIAHRLSTLSEMDRILVFDKGHIIEDGTHKQLLKNKGHYARMWNMQAGGFLPEVEDE